MGGACSNPKEPRRDNQNRNQHQQPVQQRQPQRPQNPSQQHPHNQNHHNGHNGHHQQQQIHPMRQQTMQHSVAPHQFGQFQQQQPVQQSQMLQRSHTGYMPPSFQQRNGAPQVPPKTKVLYNQVMVRQKTLKMVKGQDEQYHLEFTYDSLVPSQYTIYFFINEKAQFFSKLVMEIQPNQQYNNNLVPEVFQIKENEVGGEKQYISKTNLDLNRMDPNSLKHMTNDQTSENFWPIVIKMEQINPRQVIYMCCEYEQHGENFEVKVVAQKLELQFQSYQIQEIYGINNTQLIQGGKLDEKELANEENTNRECIICFTDLIDTVIMPCRHMCICMECAKSITQQKQKHKKLCPICRKQIEQFLRIKKEPKKEDEEQQKQIVNKELENIKQVPQSSNNIQPDNGQQNNNNNNENDNNPNSNSLLEDF